MDPHGQGPSMGIPHNNHNNNQSLIQISRQLGLPIPDPDGAVTPPRPEPGSISPSFASMQASFMTAFNPFGEAADPKWKGKNNVPVAPFTASTITARVNPPPPAYQVPCGQCDWHAVHPWPAYRSEWQWMCHNTPWQSCMPSTSTSADGGGNWPLGDDRVMAGPSQAHLPSSSTSPGIGSSWPLADDNVLSGPFPPSVPNRSASFAAGQPDCRGMRPDVPRVPVPGPTCPDDPAEMVVAAIEETRKDLRDALTSTEKEYEERITASYERLVNIYDGELVNQIFADADISGWIKPGVWKLHPESRQFSADPKHRVDFMPLVQAHQHRLWSCRIFGIARPMLSQVLADLEESPNNTSLFDHTVQSYRPGLGRGCEVDGEEDDAANHEKYDGPQEVQEGKHEENDHGEWDWGQDPDQVKVVECSGEEWVVTIKCETEEEAGSWNRGGESPDEEEDGGDEVKIPEGAFVPLPGPAAPVDQPEISKRACCLDDNQQHPSVSRWNSLRSQSGSVGESSNAAQRRPMSWFW